MTAHRPARPRLVTPCMLAGLAALAMTMTPTDASALDFGFGVGISVKGGPQFGGTDEPSDESFGDGSARSSIYPGWFGVGYGVGGYIEPRIFDLVGLELGFTYEESSGEGDINDRPITLNTEDLIVNLHARIVTPGMVKFMFGIGPDFIVPLGASVDKDPSILNDLSAVERDLTTALGLAIGAEIDAIYVRIPIELRFRYTPMSDNYDDRLEEFNAVTGRHVYKTNWNYQGLVMVGLQYYVDVWSLL